jgi:serine/threonine-protein kinase
MPTVDREELEKRLGQVISGKWTLERLIGAGGMAAVYAAKHEIGRKEAIKILHPHVATDKELVARFNREAHAVNRFSHAGAVEVRDIDVTDSGEPFLVMELLEGESLARKLKKDGVSTEDGLQLIDELLDVLTAAHAEGVIHRDIKPSNLFIEPDGKLKVLDFGVAQLKHAPGTLITDAGTTLGTVAYMPPEQLRGEEIDHRADIYAVGATLFRIVSGEKVHLGEEDEVARKVLKGPPRTLVDVVPDASEGVQRIVDRALAHVAGRRYPDAKTMQADVRAVVAGDVPPYATARLDEGDSPRDQDPLPAAGSPVRVTEVTDSIAAEGAEEDEGVDRDSDATDVDEDGLTDQKVAKTEAPTAVAKTIIEDEVDEDATTKKRAADDGEPDIDLEAPTRHRGAGKTEIADDEDLPTRVRKDDKPVLPRVHHDAPRSLSHLEQEGGGKGLMWVVLVILVAVVAAYTLRDRGDETPAPREDRSDPAKPRPDESSAPKEPGPDPVPAAPSSSTEPAPSGEPSSSPSAVTPGGSTAPPTPGRPPPLLPSGLPTSLPSAWPTALPSSLPWPPQLPSALRPKPPPPPSSQPPPVPPPPAPPPPAPAPAPAPKDTPAPE